VGSLSFSEPSLKSLRFLTFVFELFRCPSSDETVPTESKPFFACSAELRKPLMVIKRPTNSVGKNSFGDSQMRTVSFVLALTFLVAGSSMAGSVESSLPGVGTFTYNGSPIVTPAPLVVAVN
jgi:hypothetical protein